nr:MAG TPA: hypothetical protein [Caudoviricetes sp.]
MLRAIRIKISFSLTLNNTYCYICKVSGTETISTLI